MFAVIKTGGKQYKVAANDVLKIEKLAGVSGDTVTFDQVLMVGEGDSVTVGAPLVDGALVAAELVEQARGKKIIVFKKRRRQNSRRRNGHRQDLTVVKITEILTGGAKPSEAVKKAEPKAEAPAAKAKASGTEAAPAATVVDDVKMIGGVGPALEKKLAALGVTSLKQIAEFTAADIERVDAELNFKGRIEREEWVEQAKELLAGKPPRAKADQKAATAEKASSKAKSE